MSQQKVAGRVVVSKNGGCQVIVDNNGGQNCLNLTGDLEKSLGSVDEASRVQTSPYQELDPVKLAAHLDS
jgi:hypothetical protein